LLDDRRKDGDVATGEEVAKKMMLEIPGEDDLVDQIGTCGSLEVSIEQVASFQIVQEVDGPFEREAFLTIHGATPLEDVSCDAPAAVGKGLYQRLECPEENASSRHDEPGIRAPFDDGRKGLNERRQALVSAQLPDIQDDVIGSPV